MEQPDFNMARIRTRKQHRIKHQNDQYHTMRKHNYSLKQESNDDLDELEKYPQNVNCNNHKQEMVRKG